MVTRPMYVNPVIPSWVPDKLSGRDITNRGVHMLPFGFHTIWMRKDPGGIQKPTRDFWLSELKEMSMSWVVIINDGDSVIQEIDGITPIEALLDAGVIPIIRGRLIFPGHFQDCDTVKRTVEIYARYGLKPPWIIGNEPLDIREWKNHDVPPYDEAMAIVADRWMEAASDVVGLGAVVGFPDGPVYSKNPFELIKTHISLFKSGLAFYAAHNYGKGRPIDYPYDLVSKYGIRLTEEGYRDALDDYADDRSWCEESLDQINTARKALKDPSKTAIRDPVCFRGWEQIVNWSLESFGFQVPMALTEGGWVPRDRAGSTNLDIDIRWPHTTPKMAGKKTVSMYNVNSPFFAICPWLIADDAMVLFGYVGWPYDAWYGWAYTDKYDYDKPVVSMLKNEQAMPLRLWAAMDCKNIVWSGYLDGQMYGGVV
jgi:hypothetical protein